MHRPWIKVQVGVWGLGLLCVRGFTSEGTGAGSPPHLAVIRKGELFVVELHSRSGRPLAVQEIKRLVAKSWNLKPQTRNPKHSMLMPPLLFQESARPCRSCACVCVIACANERPRIREQIEEIIESSDNAQTRQPPIGILTTEERDTWARLRAQVSPQQSLKACTEVRDGRV